MEPLPFRRERQQNIPSDRDTERTRESLDTLRSFEDEWRSSIYSTTTITAPPTRPRAPLGFAREGPVVLDESGNLVPTIIVLLAQVVQNLEGIKRLASREQVIREDYIQSITEVISGIRYSIYAIQNIPPSSPPLPEVPNRTFENYLNTEIDYGIRYTRNPSNFLDTTFRDHTTRLGKLLDTHRFLHDYYGRV